MLGFSGKEGFNYYALGSMNSADTDLRVVSNLFVERPERIELCERLLGRQFRALSGCQAACIEEDAYQRSILSSPKRLQRDLGHIHDQVRFELSFASQSDLISHPDAMCGHWSLIL